MTPAALAALHAAAFTQDRPWQEAEFASLLDSPFMQLFTRPGGFALTRTIAGESELLTLAVDPARQRQGLGRALLHDWLAALPADCDSAFLEVAADNLPARAPCLLRTQGCGGGRCLHSAAHVDPWSLWRSRRPARKKRLTLPPACALNYT